MTHAITVRNLTKYFPLNSKHSHALRSGLEHAMRNLFRRHNGKPLPPIFDRCALNDVSFDVTPGECVALIGHNGAGKSVLLRLLSRVTRPISGEAYLYGSVGSVLDIGVGFNRDLNGRENVFLQGAILGIKRSDLLRKFDEISEFAGIGDLMEQPLKSYSNGTLVRLAFAIAMQLEPDILLLDEVLAVADEEFLDICSRKLTDLQREGRTILIASHDMALLQKVCTRALWFEHGRLVGDGPMAEIAVRYHAHLHGAAPVPFGS